LTNGQSPDTNGVSELVIGHLDLVIAGRKLKTPLLLRLLKKVQMQGGVRRAE
jgi:hypothetical protein